MAVPVARVYLKVAHATLPALLPTPPNCNRLPLLSTPPPCIAAILSKPLANKPGRADADERWDARKTKPASAAAEPSASSSSSGSRSADSVKSIAGHRSPPPPKPGRADSVDRWDAHKKAASTASSSSSSATPSLVSNKNKWPISRAMSAERWDVHKKPRPAQADQRLDDGESSTGSNDNIDTEEEEEEEEEILWKPRRAMYAGPGFIGAAPESRMLPMPTAFLVPVA